MSRRKISSPIEAGERISQMVLRTQLQSLRLQTFVDEYEPVAQDAA